MKSLRIVLLVLIAALLSVNFAELVFAADPPAGKGIKLISGICESETLNGSGLQLFIDFFQCVWPWLLSVAGGVAALNGVIGGVMMTMAGDDSGMRGEGKNKLLFSIAGLLMVAFAGTLLRILNPSFYK